ncbi:MAG: hypothetical protein ACE5KH_03400, partial [Candidatus Geothermarchaeales archaeon]
IEEARNRFRMPEHTSVGLLIGDEKQRERIHSIVKVAGITAHIVSSPHDGGPWRLLLTDRDDIEPSARYRTVKVTTGLRDRNLLRLIRLLRGAPRKVGNMLVGIDPGKRIGTAAFVGNELIDALATDGPGEVLMWLRDLMSVLAPQHVRIRIGLGQRWREIHETILDSLSEEVTVEFVDEKSTTRTYSYTERKFGKDISAAIKIALKL